MFLGCVQSIKLYDVFVEGIKRDMFYVSTRHMHPVDNYCILFQSKLHKVYSVLDMVMCASGMPKFYERAKGGVLRFCWSFQSEYLEVVFRGDYFKTVSELLVLCKDMDEYRARLDGVMLG